MKIEVIINSAKIPGLNRKVSFDLRELEDMTEFLSHELLDEVEKLRADESRLMEWIGSSGKKIRF